MITSQQSRHNWKVSEPIMLKVFTSEHLFKAVVKQTECLEAKAFGLGCLDQDFILWSYVMRSLPKFIKAVDDEISMGINKHLYNPLDIDNWQLIQNSLFEPVPRMELNDIKKYEEIKSIEWKKRIRFGRFDRRLLGTLIPHCWLEDYRSQHGAVLTEAPRKAMRFEEVYSWIKIVNF